jgi:Methyltransferase domain
MPNKLKRWGQKILLRGLLRDRFYFSQDGYCACCNQRTEFLADNAWLRDYFHCVKCGSIPRQRALLHVLETRFPGWRDLAVHESSPSSGGASARIRDECRGYVSSQYFPDQEFGSMVRSHRNENLESMTFPDDTFDIVVTQDVMEHVYNPDAVFREIARTLKPGGAHIFTAPLVNKHKASQLWATKNADGSPQFLFEPDFHGNPVDEKGSPVTMRWGYDIVDHIRKASGLETVIEYTDDLEIGVRAEYIEVLITTKPASNAGLRPLSPSRS